MRSKQEERQRNYQIENLQKHRNNYRPKVELQENDLDLSGKLRSQ